MCLKEKSNINTKEILAEDIIKQCKELETILQGDRLKSDLFSYEVVRQQGKYNMLDPNARELTGLSKERYIYIIENYSELMQKYPDIKEQAKLILQYIKSANIAKIIATEGCKNCINIASKS